MLRERVTRPPDWYVGRRPIGSREDKNGENFLPLQDLSPKFYRFVNVPESTTSPCLEIV
jgi:hypothetical protein